MTHAAPESDDSTALSDKAVALLRTAVPAWWGTVAAWLLTQLATLLPTEVHTALADLLTSAPARALAATAAIAGWYWLWRRVEHLVPDWLIRLALGSARTPGYALTPAPVGADGVADITSLTTTERTNLASLRDALDEEDPVRTALDRILTT